MNSGTSELPASDAATIQSGEKQMLAGPATASTGMGDAGRADNPPDAQDNPVAHGGSGGGAGGSVLPAPSSAPGSLVVPAVTEASLHGENDVPATSANATSAGMADPGRVVNPPPTQDHLISREGPGTAAGPNAPPAPTRVARDEPGLTAGPDCLPKGKTQEQHDLAAQIEISIQPVSGAAFSVAVSSAATVGDVKAAIRSAKGLSSGCQHLVKTEEPLDDCQSLRELFVAEKRWLLFLVVNTANSEVAVLFALMQAREGLAALQSWASLRNDMAIEEAQALQLRGVRMTGDHVMELQLGRCQLNGRIGGIQWKMLPKLTIVNLNENGITGTIPDFSKNTALKYLDISENQCTGNIGDFSNNVNLVELNLALNGLTGEIGDFSKNVNLTHLYLYENGFTGEIGDFSKNVNLTHLYLNQNNFTGEIGDFSKCRGLQKLNICYNKCTGEIGDFSQNTALQQLQLQGNKLTGEIPDFSKNTALQTLNLGVNKLTGEIGDFSKNVNLVQLNLARNGLTGEIGDFSRNVNLVKLNLAGNGLTGTKEWKANKSNYPSGCSVYV